MESLESTWSPLRRGGTSLLAEAPPPQPSFRGELQATCGLHAHDAILSKPRASSQASAASLQLERAQMHGLLRLGTGPPVRHTFLSTYCVPGTARGAEDSIPPSQHPQSGGAPGVAARVDIRVRQTTETS